MMMHYIKASGSSELPTVVTRSCHLVVLRPERLVHGTGGGGCVLEGPGGLVTPCVKELHCEKKKKKELHCG